MCNNSVHPAIREKEKPIVRDIEVNEASLGRIKIVYQRRASHAFFWACLAGEREVGGLVWRLFGSTIGIALRVR